MNMHLKGTDIIILIILLFSFSDAIIAQPGNPMVGDLMNVSPVTDKILMIHIRDGHIITYGVNQGPDDNIIYHSPTDLDLAMNPENYTVTSINDLNYSDGLHPINIGRKSKGLEYQNGWDNPPYIMQHWIYLELPEVMITGKEYTISLNKITENKSSVRFVFDENRLRSETVRVNMVGFPEEGQKLAYLSHWMGDFDTPVHQNGGLNLDNKAGSECRVLNYKTRETVFTTTIQKRMDKTEQETGSDDFPGGNYTNADVWECDFSVFSTPGEYVVAVEGIGSSYPFEIGNNITREAFYYAMKGLFWQRQGIAKEVEPDSLLPRGHHPEDITWKFDKDWIVDSGYDESGFNLNSPRVQGVWGHYYDAGDWDGYTHHYRVPAHLLLLYDLAPEGFHDGDVGNRYKLDVNGTWIDEGQNGKPDLLDESAWLLNYYRRARHVLKDYGTTGGVPGYTGRDAIPSGNNITAWMDTRDWYLSGENLEATFAYSALAAYYAVNLNQYHQLNGEAGNHPEYDEWITEAIESWEWAVNHREVKTDNERRARGFAAAILYRATGDQIYQTIFEQYWKWEPSKNSGEWGGVNTWTIAATLFSLIPEGHTGLNKDLQNSCRDHIIERADAKVEDIRTNGFRNSMEYYQYMQIGGFSTPRGTVLAAAHRLTGNGDYLKSIQHAVNYVLGGNQLNMTYLSGLGERSDQWIFQPSAYLVNNKNSMVYTPESFIGQTSYFGATGLHSSYWHDTGEWKWSEYLSRMAAYPQAADPPSVWPGAEQKFQNRYSIQGGEFTIHQQMNHMIFGMGYVNAMANTSSTRFNLEVRPEVTLNLSDGDRFAKTGCHLTVHASENTRKVEYYYNWHYIGESSDSENDFGLFWEPNLADGSQVLITAVAYNARGRKSLPSIAGESQIAISGEADCASIDEPGQTEIPETFRLYQNYPNPFNSSTKIRFDIPYSIPVAVKVFDLTGRIIRTLIDYETRPAGEYAVNFNTSGLSSGNYVYNLEAGSFNQSKVMTFIK